MVNKRLADREWIAGDYSIADMATFPWMRLWMNQGQEIEDYPHLGAWLERNDERSAVQRGLDVMADQIRKKPVFTEEERSIMFGAKQFEAR